jgi:hypothetical protein
MDIIYKITYLPHLGTNFPKYYIGSKKNWNANRFYLGSPSSKLVFDYTNGQSLAKWWKKETKANPHHFILEILQEADLDARALVLLEKSWHLKLGVLSDEYFNRAIATNKWTSLPNTTETKKLKSEKTKAFWDSEAGKEKKLRLSERNRRTKSQELKLKWKNPTETMLAGIEKSKQNRRVISGDEWREKHSNRKPRSQRVVICNNIKYENAKEAAKILGIDVVNIRRRCRLPQYKDWSYE